MVGSLFSLGNECQTENTETWHCLCCDAASFEWVIDVKMPRPKDSYLREKFAKAKSKGKAKVKARTWKIDQESMSNVPLSLSLTIDMNQHAKKIKQVPFAVEIRNQHESTRFALDLLNWLFVDLMCSY